MYSAVDSTGPETHPVLEAHLEWSAFFVGFIVIGQFFLFSLFVSIVVVKYLEMKVTILH
jgi:hypothetical protein